MPKERAVISVTNLVSFLQLGKKSLSGGTSGMQYVIAVCTVLVSAILEGTITENSV